MYVPWVGAASMPLRAAPLAEVYAWLNPYRRHWTERLDALEQYLEDNP